MFLFFKQKTAYEMRISDWSSDVCSSDLVSSRLLDRRCRRPGAEPPLPGRPGETSNAPALRRPAPVVRERRHVADRGDREAHRLHRAQRRSTARARALNVDTEGTSDVLLRIPAGLLVIQLGRLEGRHARALAHVPAGRKRL